MQASPVEGAGKVAEVVIYDTDNNVVFDSDAHGGPAKAETFLTDHLGEKFRVVIRSSTMGSVTFSGEMVAELNGD